MRTFLMSWTVVVAGLRLSACGAGGSCRTAGCTEQCVDSSGRHNANGSDAPSASGTCGGSSCTAGCSCNKNSAGQAQCLCTGAIPPSGYLCVSAANCGAISCGSGCNCSDATTSTCVCP